MEEVAKNLWLLLTVVLPGMATYGALRLFLILFDCGLDKGAFEKLDASAFVTTCLVLAIALLQQAISIGIEAGLAAVCKRSRNPDRRYYKFFCDRFRLAASGKMNESQTRVFGNFFLSLNVTIGQFALLAYFLHRGLGFSSPAVRVIAVLAAAALFSAWFRLHNALSIIPAIEQEIQSKKNDVFPIMVKPGA